MADDGPELADAVACVSGWLVGVAVPVGDGKRVGVAEGRGKVGEGEATCVDAADVGVGVAEGARVGVVTTVAGAVSNNWPEEVFTGVTTVAGAAELADGVVLGMEGGSGVDLEIVTSGGGRVFTPEAEQPAIKINKNISKKSGNLTRIFYPNPIKSITNADGPGKRRGNKKMKRKEMWIASSLQAQKQNVGMIFKLLRSTAAYS